MVERLQAGISAGDIANIAGQRLITGLAGLADLPFNLASGAEYAIEVPTALATAALIEALNLQQDEDPYLARVKHRAADFLEPPLQSPIRETVSGALTQAFGDVEPAIQAGGLPTQALAFGSELAGGFVGGAPLLRFLSTGGTMASQLPLRAQMAREAALGFGIEAPAAIPTSFNAENNFDPMSYGAQVGFGTLAGALTPPAFKYGAKAFNATKDAIKNISRQASGLLKQSDAMNTIKQMRHQQAQAAYANQMAREAAEQEIQQTIRSQTEKPKEIPKIQLDQPAPTIPIEPQQALPAADITPPKPTPIPETKIKQTPTGAYTKAQEPAIAQTTDNAAIINGAVDVGNFALNPNNKHIPVKIGRDIQSQLMKVSKNIGRVINEFTNNIEIKTTNIRQDLYGGRTEKEIEKIYKAANDLDLYNLDLNKLDDKIIDVIEKQQAGLNAVYDRLMKAGFEMPPKVKGWYVPRRVQDVSGYIKQLKKDFPKIAEQVLVSLENNSSQFKNDPTVKIHQLFQERGFEKIPQQYLKYYHSPFDSFKITTRQMGEQLALIELVDGNVKGKQQYENLANYLVGKHGTDIANPFDINTATTLLKEMFMPRVPKTELAAQVKNIGNTMRAIARASLLNKSGTAIRNIAELPARVLGRTGTLQDFLFTAANYTKTPISTAKMGVDYVGSQDVDLSTAAKKIQDFALIAFNPSQIMEGDLLQKVAHNYLHRNATLIRQGKKPQGNFKTVMDDFYTPKQQEKIYEQITKWDGINELGTDAKKAVLTIYRNLLGGITGKADYSPFSFSELGQSVGFLMSWGIKNAAINRDLTFGAMARGDYSRGLNNMFMLFGVSTIANGMINGYIKGDKFGLTMDEFIDQSTIAFLQSIHPLFNKYLLDNLLSDQESFVANLASPGLATTIGTYSETGQLFFEGMMTGKITAAVDPYYNKKFTNLPIPLSDIAYKALGGNPAQEKARIEYQDPRRKERAKIKAAERYMKEGIDPKLAGTLIGRREEENLKVYEQMVKSGALTPQDLARQKILERNMEVFF